MPKYRRIPIPNGSYPIFKNPCQVLLAQPSGHKHASIETRGASSLRGCQGLLQFSLFTSVQESVSSQKLGVVTEFWASPAQSSRNGSYVPLPRLDCCPISCTYNSMMVLNTHDSCIGASLYVLQTLRRPSFTLLPSCWLNRPSQAEIRKITLYVSSSRTCVDILAFSPKSHGLEPKPSTPGARQDPCFGCCWYSLGMFRKGLRP